MVAASRPESISIASAVLAPQFSVLAANCRHKPGYEGEAQSAQRRVTKSRFEQAVPAGLPVGIPGKGVVIEGAIQQAPQFSRHFMLRTTFHRNRRLLKQGTPDEKKRANRSLMQTDTTSS
jgi:hypothetical protein